jgi:hypothetical protein
MWEVGMLYSTDEANSELSAASNKARPGPTLKQRALEEARIAERIAIQRQARLEREVGGEQITVDSVLVRNPRMAAPYWHLNAG